MNFEPNEKNKFLHKKVGLVHSIWLFVCLLVSLFVIFYFYVTLQYFSWFLSTGGSAKYYIELKKERQIELAKEYESSNMDLLKENRDILRKNEKVFVSNLKKYKDQNELVKKARYILNTYKSCPAFKDTEL